MTHFPSNKIMFVTLLAITVWFGFKFMKTSKGDFFQLNYNWENKTEIKELGEVTIDSISYNYLSINLEGEITTSPQNTYKLTFGKDTYYFRYEYAILNNHIYEFKGIEWITGIPEISENISTLTEVAISLNQAKGPSIITLGDYRLRIGEAKYFRKQIAQKTSVVFKGRYNDVFNFPHEVIDSNTSTTIISQINEVDNADYYILFFGSNDTLIPSEEIRRNISIIFKKLLIEKKAKKLFIILLPTSTNIEVNDYAMRYNSIISETTTNPKIKIIDTEVLFKKKHKKYMRKDGISITKDGYYKLANEIAKELE